MRVVIIAANGKAFCPGTRPQGDARQRGTRGSPGPVQQVQQNDADHSTSCSNRLSRGSTASPPRPAASWWRIAISRSPRRMRVLRFPELTSACSVQPRRYRSAATWGANRRCICCSPGISFQRKPRCSMVWSTRLSLRRNSNRRLLRWHRKLPPSLLHAIRLGKDMFYQQLSMEFERCLCLRQ